MKFKKNKTQRTYKSYGYNKKKSGPSKTIIFIVVGALLLASFLGAWFWHKKQKQNIPDEFVVSEQIETDKIKLEKPDDLSVIEQTTPEIYTRRPQFGGAVEQTEYPVDRSYFEDILLIGDSFAQGIQSYIKPVFPNISVEVLQVSDIMLSSEKELDVEPLEEEPEENLKQESEDETEKPISSMDIVKDIKEKYPRKNKIYISLGTDFTDYNTAEFSERYSRFVQAIRQEYPTATIYLEGLPPVLEMEKQLVDSPVNNSRLQDFNSEISRLAAHLGVNYLDTPVAVMQEDGSLPDYASVDGVHLTGQYYFLWLDYIKRHTI